MTVSGLFSKAFGPNFRYFFCLNSLQRFRMSFSGFCRKNACQMARPLRTLGGLRRTLPLSQPQGLFMASFLMHFSSFLEHFGVLFPNIWRFWHTFWDHFGSLWAIDWLAIHISRYFFRHGFLSESCSQFH